MCLLYCVTQKYFSECPGQQSMLEVPNAFRNNVLLLLGSLEFRLHNTNTVDGIWLFQWRIPVTCLKRKSFSGVYILSVGSVWIIFLS